MSKNAIVLGKVKRHTSDAFSNIYLVSNNGKKAKKKTYNNDNLEIFSDFNKKHISKNKIVMPTKEGINLSTYLGHNGTHPTSNFILNRVTFEQ